MVPSTGVSVIVYKPASPSPCKPPHPRAYV
jgi:hypothetical protein